MPGRSQLKEFSVVVVGGFSRSRRQILFACVYLLPASTFARILAGNLTSSTCCRRQILKLLLCTLAAHLHTSKLLQFFAAVAQQWSSISRSTVRSVNTGKFSVCVCSVKLDDCVTADFTKLAATAAAAAKTNVHACHR